MKFYKSAKFLIFLIIFINFLGYGIVFPILPLMTIQYGGDPIVSGILIGIFSLMQVISMPILGRLSDRYGRRPLLLYSLWGTVLSFAIMGLTHSIFWLMVARIIDGISGGNLSIAQAYMADVTDKKGRAAGMGVIAAGISLGFIIGPIWGGIFGKFGLAIPFITATLLTLVSVILTQFYLPESISKKEISYEKIHFHFPTFIKHALKQPLFLLYFINLLLFWAQSGIFTTLTLFGNDVLKLSLLGTSLIFAAFGIISVLIQGWGLGKVLKRIEEKKLFFASALISVGGLALMSIPGSLVFFILGTMVFSFGNSFTVPIVQALVSESSSEHEQGGNMGILQAFGSVGRIFGPIIAGYLYEKMSPYSPSITGAIMFVFIAYLGVFLLKYSFGSRTGVKPQLSH